MKGLWVGVQTKRVRLSAVLSELLRPHFLTLHYEREKGAWLGRQKADGTESELAHLGPISERRVVALARELHLGEGGYGIALFALDDTQHRVWVSRTEMLLAHDGMRGGGRLENALLLSGIRYRIGPRLRGLGVQNLLWEEAPRMVTESGDAWELRMQEIESYIRNFLNSVMERDQLADRVRELGL